MAPTDRIELRGLRADRHLRRAPRGARAGPAARDRPRRRAPTSPSPARPTSSPTPSTTAPSTAGGRAGRAPTGEPQPARAPGRRPLAEVVLALTHRVEAVTVTVRKLRPPVPQQLDTSACASARSSGSRRWVADADPGVPGARLEPGRPPGRSSARPSARWRASWPCRRSTRPSRSAVPAGRAPSSTSWWSSTPTSPPGSCSACATGSSPPPSGCAPMRWGPRTLDVDILWMDGVTVDEPDLEVPHPRMCRAPAS